MPGLPKAIKDICTVCNVPRVVCGDINVEIPMTRRREGYELFQFNALPETMDEIRAFAKRTKVPGTVIIRDALDVFTVLLKDCKDYPDWLARVRKAITAAGEAADAPVGAKEAAR